MVVRFTAQFFEFFHIFSLQVIAFDLLLLRVYFRFFVAAAIAPKLYYFIPLFFCYLDIFFVGTGARLSTRDEVGNFRSEDEWVLLTVHNALKLLLISEEMTEIDMQKSPVIPVDHNIVRMPVSKPQHIRSHTIPRTRLQEILLDLDHFFRPLRLVLRIHHAFELLHFFLLVGHFGKTELDLFFSEFLVEFPLEEISHC